MTVGELGRRAEGRNIARIVDFFLIVSSALLLMLPSLLTGAPEGHDSHVHFVYVDAFAKQMAEGDLYPRWLEHLWLGAGGADFYFYAPLPYWLAGTLRFIACPGCDASQLLALTGFVLLAISGLGFRAFALRFASRGAVNIAAILYMALPYHLGADWYDRFAFGEFAATALLPWLLSAFIDCASGRSGGVRLALLSGLVVLSHLPSTMIVATGCLGLMLFTGRERGWRSFSTPVVAGVIGFGLAAFYWYPAVTLLDSIRDDLLQLPYTQWRYNILHPANFGRILFYDMIWLPFTLLTASALAALLVAWRDNRAMARIVVALLVVVWLMVTPLSTVLWDMTPIKRVQFPWRFMILADIAFGLAAMMAVEKLTGRAGSGLQRGVAAASLCAILVVTALFAHPGVRGRQGAVISPEVTVWMSAGALSWLPSETPPTIDLREPMHIYDLAESLAVQPPIQLLDPGNAEILSVERRRLTFEAELPAPGTVVIRRTFWRYWRLRDATSGREIELQPATGFPLITAELPAGRGQYVLELPVLMAEQLGALISAFALAVLLCWWWLTRRRTGS